MMRKKNTFISLILLVLMIVVGFPANIGIKAGSMTEVQAATTLQNPRIVSDSSMEAGYKVTWDCIWFGSYPQTEIVDKAETCGTYGKDWENDSDYVMDVSLYYTLKNATDWDSRGNLTLGGEKYKRIKRCDATFSGWSGDACSYDWNDDSTYHYFRYEKIKWKVLKVSGSQAFLLADLALDNQRYHNEDTSLTWASSNIRSWLNGYGASENDFGTNYNSKSFMEDAFSSVEQKAIVSTSLDNKTSGPYSREYGGDNTIDKVFLLSAYDLFITDSSDSYGFLKEGWDGNDEARKCKSTTYAKAMGTSSYNDYSGNCQWWLRSPSISPNFAFSVHYRGYSYDSGLCNNGVRPALNLNLSSSSLWSYAGTVCSDGTVNEGGSSFQKTATPPAVKPATLTISYQANGGKASSKSKKVTVGSKYGTLATAKRKGYAFSGWYTRKSGGTKITKDSKVTASVKTLYAHWTKIKKITVKYNAGGGKAKAKSKKVTTTKKYGALTTATRKGYTFAGWYTKKSGGTKITANSIVTASVKTLYAHWTAVKYKITYNLNGGTNGSNPATYTITSTVNLVSPKKTGYTFKGWYKEKNFKNKVGKIAKGSTGNKSFYAKWAANIYYIKFDSNSNGAASGSMKTSIITCTYGKNVVLPADGYKMEGKIFDSWNTRKDGTGNKYLDQQIVRNLTGENNKTITLYAQWVTKKMVITEDMLYSTKYCTYLDDPTVTEMINTITQDMETIQSNQGSSDIFVALRTVMDAQVLGQTKWIFDIQGQQTDTVVAEKIAMKYLDGMAENGATKEYFESIVSYVKTSNKTTEYLGKVFKKDDDIEELVKALSLDTKLPETETRKIVEAIRSDEDFCYNITKDFETAGIIFDVADIALSTAMTMQADRQMVQDMLEKAPSGSYLHKGLSRINTKLKQGDVMTFMQGMVEEKYFDKMLEEALSQGIKESLPTAGPVLGTIKIWDIGWKVVGFIMEKTGIKDYEGWQSVWIAMDNQNVCHGILMNEYVKILQNINYNEGKSIQELKKNYRLAYNMYVSSILDVEDYFDGFSKNSNDFKKLRNHITMYKEHLTYENYIKYCLTRANNDQK